MSVATDGGQGLHVVIVARGYPREGSRTHGIFEFDQARALAAAGHRVTLASLDVRSARRRRPWGIRHTERDGVRILDLNWPVGRVPPAAQAAVLGAAWRTAIADIGTQLGRPDIVHAHFSPWGHAAAVTRHECPVVITEHWTKLGGEVVDTSLIRVAARAYAAADAVIAVSPVQAALLRRRFGVDARVVPNVVDLATFTPALQRRVPSHHRVVSVSGLRPIKRQDALVRAVAELPGVTLDIVGEGPDRASLDALVADLGVGDRVRLHGHLERDAIADRFAEADVFALPSEFETFGVVHVEAMAAGLPVVTTPSGGPEQLITPATGLVVPGTGDPLVEGLRRALATDWDRQHISAGVQRFSPDAVAAQLTALYRELV